MKLNYAPLLPILLIAIIFVSGCIQQAPVAPISIKPSQPVLDACTQACKDALTAGKELGAGPCLLDPIPQDPNWVCDVAHDPRQPIDNLPENQCQAYRNGTAQNFIEVVPDCKIIKTG